jgi:hypothetical protein
MTQSKINTNINIHYPTANDNDSQIFRDNFNTIKASLTTAKLELSDLLSNSIRSDNTSDNFNNTLIKNQVHSGMAIYRHDISGLQLQSFEIDYTDGQYQTVQIGADVGIKLKNFPTDSTSVNVGKLRLHIATDRTTRKIEFTSTTAVIKYDPNFPLVNTKKLNIPGSGGKDPVIVDIWQVNDNNSTPTIYIKYIGCYSYRAAPPSPAVSYVDNQGTITSQNSTSVITDDTTPGIKITNVTNFTPVLYINGVYTESVYDSISGILTPTAIVLPGTYNFTYTLADTQGNESMQSTPLVITIDTSAPTTGSISLAYDTGSNSSDGITNNGQITVSNLDSGCSWQYSIDGGNNWVDGTGNSFTLASGTYGIGQIKMRQINAIGSVQTVNIPTNSYTITVDTNAPTSGTLSLTVDDGVSSSDGNSSVGGITVSGLEPDATWEYSIDGGSTWTAGSGTSFTVSNGTYPIGQLKVRQTDVAGNIQTSMATNTIEITIAPPPPSGGQIAFTTPGTHVWTAPPGVTSVCVVAVGGGGSGQGSSPLDEAGGGGGGLGWKNNIQVTPGGSYTVVVGVGGTGGGSGGVSYFISTGTVCGYPGKGSSVNFIGTGGDFVGDGGGWGGNGGSNGGDAFTSLYGGGGGGAAGYSGNGGAGADGSDYHRLGSNGSGGGGGGGCSNHGGGGGGGVGLLGEGASGMGSSDSGGSGGSGGSNGSGGDPGSVSNNQGGNGGQYGGGGGGGSDGSRPDSEGGNGAVRIIWGSNRAFPSTNTGDL